MHLTNLSLVHLRFKFYTEVYRFTDFNFEFSNNFPASAELL